MRLNDEGRVLQTLEDQSRILMTNLLEPNQLQTVQTLGTLYEGVVCNPALPSYGAEENW